MTEPSRWGYIRRARIAINCCKENAALSPSHERSGHLERAARYQRALDRVEAMTDEDFQTKTMNDPKFWSQLLS